MVSVFFSICNIFNSHTSSQHAVGRTVVPIVVSMGVVINYSIKGKCYEILINDLGSGFSTLRYGC